MYLLFFTGYILIQWIGKIEYWELLPLFQLLIVATFIYCLSLIPHLGLYALRKDKMIVWSQCLTFLLFSSFLYIALKVANINYIAYGMIISFSVLLFLKLAMFIKLLVIIRRSAGESLFYSNRWYLTYCILYRYKMHSVTFVIANFSVRYIVYYKKHELRKVRKV